MEDDGGAVVALEDCGFAAALGGDVGRWFKIAVVALGGGSGRRICDDALESALSKQRAYITMLASALARMAREDMSNARDIRRQRWQQDRHIAAAVVVAAVQIR